MKHSSVFQLYQFLFSNTFIAGMFNFLIPLFLLSKGFTFSTISFYIAFNAITFFFCIFFFEYMNKLFSRSSLIAITYGLYSLYLTTIFFMQINLTFIIILSIVSGIYTCFFWLIQRIIFLETLGKNDTGRKFGNIQIFVGIIAQVAILLGSYILDYYSFIIIYVLSLCLLCVLILWTYWHRTTTHLTQLQRTTFRTLINFRDNYNSKIMFIIDGIFLFLESHFWLITLFLFTKEQFFEVGKIITTIAIAFFLLYILIKNRIDARHTTTVYYSVTVLYALSWILRYIFFFISNSTTQYILIYGIGFLSLLFRLVLNKMFFEHAQQPSNSHYILLKSYVSQFFIFLTFISIGIIFMIVNESHILFQLIFLIGAVLSLLYLPYRAYSTQTL